MADEVERQLGHGRGKAGQEARRNQRSAATAAATSTVLR